MKNRLIKAASLSVCALSLLSTLAKPSQAAPQQAFKADDFVETVGVCTPFQSWSDAQWAVIKPQLGALGVRYFRAGLEHVDNPTNLARLQSLRSDYGMKVLAIVGP